MTEAELVSSTLKDWGAAGAVIAVLMTVITSLVTALIFQYRQINTLNMERRLESGTVIKLGEGTIAALAKLTDASEERNSGADELADAIKDLAEAIRLVDQRIGFYHDGNVEKIQHVREVVGSLSDAVRVNTGIATEVRNAALGLVTSMSDAKSKLDTIAATAAAARRAR